MIFNVGRTLRIFNDWARKNRHLRLHSACSWASNASFFVEVPEGDDLKYVLVIHDGLLEHDSLIATFHLARFTPGMPVHANPNITRSRTTSLQNNERTTTPSTCARGG